MTGDYYLSNGNIDGLPEKQRDHFPSHLYLSYSYIYERSLLSHDPSFPLEIPNSIAEISRSSYS